MANARKSAPSLSESLPLLRRQCHFAWLRALCRGLRDKGVRCEPMSSVSTQVEAEQAPLKRAARCAHAHICAPAGTPCPQQPLSSGFRERSGELAQRKRSALRSRAVVSRARLCAHPLPTHFILSFTFPVRAYQAHSHDALRSAHPVHFGWNPFVLWHLEGDRRRHFSVDRACARPAATGQRPVDCFSFDNHREFLIVGDGRLKEGFFGTRGCLTVDAPSHNVTPSACAGSVSRSTCIGYHGSRVSNSLALHASCIFLPSQDLTFLSTNLLNPLVDLADEMESITRLHLAAVTNGNTAGPEAIQGTSEASRPANIRMSTKVSAWGVEVAGVVCRA